MGSGCIDPHFLDLGTSWRWVVNFTPRPLYPREKSPRYPLDRRLGGPQSRSGRPGEEKILGPTGTRTPTPLSSNSVASRYTDYAIPAPTLRKLRADLKPMNSWYTSVRNSSSLCVKSINMHRTKILPFVLYAWALTSFGSEKERLVRLY
jgi:hypothetical protein